MMRKVFCLIILTLSGVHALAATIEVNTDFVAANAAYTKGDYANARAAYQRIIDAGKESGNVFYNIGNCYYKEGDLSRAVLNYERARRLIPADPDLRENSAYVRSRLGVSDDEPSRGFAQRIIKKIFAGMSLNSLAVFFFLANSIIFGMLIIERRFARFTWLRYTAGVVALIACCALIEGSDRIRRYASEAVVIKNTDARFEPQQDATVHFVLLGGEKVYVIRAHAPWVKIERSDGKAGWIDETVIEKISLDAL